MKEKTLQNTYWPFELDKIHDYAFWNNAFTPRECEQIIEIGSKKNLKKGTVIKSDKNLSHIRDSDLTWLYAADDMGWVFEKVTNIITKLNKKYFQFNLNGLGEGFQFTKYKSPQGKYEKHVDRAFDTPVRKLSLTIQLSDPSSYEGGELLLHQGSEPTIISKEQGYLCLFPSYTLHEVKPVLKNERFSLVGWVTGESFK
tara:strand:+ start:2044 stop:2640 length:597 start_codon:yes stop_codon:yes gene_type:complete